ncbi:NADH-quinone oxidoreductase subunit N [Bdellovibrionota bacterium]
MNLPILPELIVVGTAFVVLLLDLFLSERGKVVLAPIALAGLVASFVSVVNLLPAETVMFGGRFVFDGMAGWFKLFFLIAGIITVAISLDLLDGRFANKEGHTEQLGSRGEYYTVLLFTLTGMMFLMSARDLITLYISLELTTIPLFILTAWKRTDRKSGEAGLKYVILGALSSATLLYGLGILYGLTGSTTLSLIAQNLTMSPAFWLSAALITAGIGFKLTLVPFHMWAADVYQGAPTPITAYLTVASKGAGLAFMFQLYWRVMGDFIADWGTLIAIFATATMTLGNVVAIVQKNIKRFMAFSAISQAGYLLLGFLGPYKEGFSAMVFYLFVYVITNMTVFAVIVFYSNETGREEISEYRGLSRTNPLIALVMMAALFSLAGIPPLSGFVGKFFLFSIAAKSGYHWLVGVAAINSTISLYYYLRVVRQMYMEPIYEGAKQLKVTPVLATTICAGGLGTVLVGIIPFFYETIYAHTSSFMTSDIFTLIKETYQLVQ